MAVLLGIDYGDSRIGVSICDSMGLVASPKCILDGKQNLNTIVGEIGGLCRKNGAAGIVIGWPLNMDGTEGARIHRTEKFVERFGETYPDVSVVKWDERLTTKAADKAMLEMGVSQRKKGVSDMIAAQMILQGYLDFLRNECK